MSFLPIIERELLVASRRRSTYRVRWWTTLIATGITLITFRIVSSRPLPAGATNPIFAVLATWVFVLSALAGAFVSSDSLSQEKRDGTLGLLFLSNMRGSDIVMGKFSALWVNAFFGVLALLPVIGVPLLLGGLNLGEFFRVILALINMLFFSLAAGMCVSAFGRTLSNVVGGTIGLLLLLVAGLPVMANAARVAAPGTAYASLAWFSPYYPFVCAFERVYVLNPPKFWGTLLASNLLAWFFLDVARRVLPRQWQDSGKVAESPNSGGYNLRLRGSGGLPRRRRRALSDTDAVVWLMGGAPVLNWFIWGCLGAWALVLMSNGGKSSQPELVCGGTKLIAFGFKILVAFQACRFFSESRTGGVMELLLCTPLRNMDIVTAQWRKLRRNFLLPSIVLILMGLISLAHAGRGGVFAPGRFDDLLGEPSFGRIYWVALNLGVDVLAVGYYGMWLSLSMKRPILAPAFTILFVLILPSALSWLDLVADMLFISWGVTGLQEDFRLVLSRRYQSRQELPQASPAPVAA